MSAIWEAVRGPLGPQWPAPSWQGGWIPRCLDTRRYSKSARRPKWCPTSHWLLCSCSRAFPERGVCVCLPLLTREQGLCFLAFVSTAGSRAKPFRNHRFSRTFVRPKLLKRWCEVCLGVEGRRINQLGQTNRGRRRFPRWKGDRGVWVPGHPGTASGSVASLGRKRDFGATRPPREVGPKPHTPSWSGTDVLWTSRWGDGKVLRLELSWLKKKI